MEKEIFICGYLLHFVSQSGTVNNVNRGNKLMNEFYRGSFFEVVVRVVITIWKKIIRRVKAYLNAPFFLLCSVSLLWNNSIPFPPCFDHVG